MEKRKCSMGNWDQNTLKSELIQGKEVAEKLMDHLHHSSLTQEEKEFLISKLLSCYEKALCVLAREDGVSEGHPKRLQVSMLDSPCSFGNSSSPLSEISDQDCNNKNVFKKRKTMPKWTEEVKVFTATGQDGSVDDGYSWRKYGKKVILGATYPRGYYRCTHRNSQGCPATKQVQKSDADPTTFVVNYIGAHTCHLVPLVKGKQDVSLKQEAGTPERLLEKSFSFGLRVKTEDLDTREEGNEIFPPFSFLSTPIESENNVVGDHVFSELENDFMCGNYATMMTPATFEADCFAAISPCHFGLVGNDVQTSESDLTHEIISAPTSVTNSPIGDFGDFGFSLEDLDFYAFENPLGTFP